MTTEQRDVSPERVGDWMQTFTGKKFWPLDPRVEDVDIEDVAHALSMLCRQGGHCLRFYSVAEHSVLLARYVMECGPSIGKEFGPINNRAELAMWLLLHDGSEAYLSDMVRPLKQFMPEYKIAENKLSRLVYQRYDLDPDLEPHLVKKLDNRILKDERAQNMSVTNEIWKYAAVEEAQLNIILNFWTPWYAEQEFLKTFSRLSKLRSI